MTKESEGNDTTSAEKLVTNFVDRFGDNFGQGMYDAPDPDIEGTMEQGKGNGNASDPTKASGGVEGEPSQGAATASRSPAPHEGGPEEATERVEISPEVPQREDVDELTMSEVDFVDENDAIHDERKPVKAAPSSIPPPPPPPPRKHMTVPGYPAPVPPSLDERGIPEALSEDTVKVSLERVPTADTDEMPVPSPSPHPAPGVASALPPEPPRPPLKQESAVEQKVEANAPRGKPRQKKQVGAKRFPTLPPDRLQEDAAAAVRIADGGEEEKRTPERRSSPPEMLRKFPDLPVAPQEVEPLPETTMETDAEKLVALIQQQLDQTPDELRAARLHYELGVVNELELDDPTRAASHYQRAVRLLPEHKPSLRGARRTLLALKRPREALPMFDAEVRVTKDPKRRATLLYAKAQVLENDLMVTNEAREVYREALELERQSVSILKALHRCEWRNESWSELAETYEKLANTIENDTAQRAALIAARAFLAEVKQGDTNKASDLYHAALSIDSKAPATLSSLKRLYHTKSRWNELITMLRQELDLSGSPGVRLVDLRQIAQLFEDKLGDMGEAIVSLETAVSESPDNAALWQNLLDLYVLAKRDTEQALALERLFELTEALSERVGVAHRLGQLFEGALDDMDSARSWYEAALELDPCFRPALDALGALYDRTQDWNALITMYTNEIGATNEENARAVAHARIAEVLENRLVRLDEAAEHYDKALGLVPEHESSFKSLTKLHAQAGRWRELAELYQRVVDRSPEKERAIAFLSKIGALYEDRLDDPAGALHAYQRILEIAPEHLGAIQAAQQAAERARKCPVLLQMLEREVALTKTTTTKVALLCRAAEVCDRYLNDVDAAIQRYQRVLKIDPTHAVALKSLGWIYRRAGRWEDLLKAYQAELTHTALGTERARLVHKMGELSETRMGREKEAITHYKQALGLDPDHRPSYEALVRLLTSRANFADLAKLMETWLERVTDETRRAALAYEIGQIHEEKLSKPMIALGFYEQAVAATTDHQAAQDGRSRILYGAGKWAKLAESLDQTAETSTEEILAINAKLEEGLIRAHRLGDRDIAIECFEWVLRRSPGNRGALLALEELNLDTGAPLVEIYHQQADMFTDVATQIAALRELARLQLEAGFKGEAEITFSRILELEERDESSLEAMVRLAGLRQDHATSVSMLSRLVSLVDDTELTAVYMGEMAQLIEKQGDPNTLGAYRAALALDPECLVMTRGFTRAARQSGDANALREAALREARTTRDKPLAVRLLQESAELRYKENDFDGTVIDLEKALELDPGNQLVAERLTPVLIMLNQVPKLIELLNRAADEVKKPQRSAELHLEVAGLFAAHRNNLPAAVAATRRALTEVPSHLSALTRLARYLEDNEQWQEAVETLGKVAERTQEQNALIDIHLRLASIVDDRIGEPARALASLKTVLSRDPGNARALARLSRIEAERGDYEQATKLARRLIEAAENDAQRSAALLQVAHIEGMRNRPPQVAMALSDAIAIEGADGAAAVQYKELIEKNTKHATWEGYMSALARFIDHATAKGVPVGSSHRAVATILADHLNRPNDAINTLRRGVKAEPSDVKTRLELGRRLRRLRNNDQAIDEIRLLLEHDVTIPSAWHELSQSLVGIGDAKEASAAAQPLRILKEATPEGLQAAMERNSRPGQIRPEQLTIPAFRKLLVDPARDPIAGLVTAMSGTLMKLYPTQPDRYGLSRRDRVHTRAISPTRAIADQMAMLLGIPGLDLYVHQGTERDLSVGLGKPPALFVPEWAGELSEASLVFFLVRPLVNITQELHAVDRVSSKTLAVLLAAATRQVVPGFGGGAASEAELDEQSRLIARYTPRRTRRIMASAAERYAAAPGDLKRWIKQVRTNAARIALLFCDDLIAALEVVEKTTGKTIYKGGLAADLARFWVSADAAQYRRIQGPPPAPMQ